MSTDPRDPVPARSGRSPLAPSAAEGVFRTALRDMFVLLGVLTVVGVGVGYLVAGLPGVWGALLGVGIALVFSGTTVVSVLKTARSDPARMITVIMGAWLAKILFVFVVLAVLSRFDFYDRMVLVVVLLAGVIGSAILDARAVQNGRIPYVEPPAAEPGPDPAEGRP